MFRKKKNKQDGVRNSGSSPVLDHTVLQNQSPAPLHLDLTESPLFARRKTNNQNINASLTSQSNSSVPSLPPKTTNRVTRNRSLPAEPLGKIAVYPVTDVSSVVRTSQLKDVHLENLDVAENKESSPALTPVKSLMPAAGRSDSDFSVLQTSGPKILENISLSRQNSNATVYQNVQKFLQSSDGNPSLIKKVNIAPPQKVVLTQMHSLPHPPVSPTSIYDDSFQGSAADDKAPVLLVKSKNFADAETVTRKQSQPLPAIPNSSISSQLAVSENMYQSVHRRHSPKNTIHKSEDPFQLSANMSLVNIHNSPAYLNKATNLSMLPKREIDELYIKEFLGDLDLKAILEEEPPDFVRPQTCQEKGMSLESMTCARCGEGFEPQEKMVNSNGQLWHIYCFVCAQCFKPFPNDIFYEFEGRRYCEYDFQVLFAPCCGKCNEFIIGRVIKAMNNNWHPGCFRCNECHKELADLGFIRFMGMAVCHDCNARLKAQSLNKYMCHKCHSVIDGEPLRWRGDTYHPYHFTCASCGVELTHLAREVKSRPGYTANQMNELYCLRCHDKMGIPICGACRRPIEERIVTALGKHWHVEHFVCTKCEKPFFGNRHYEKKGQAYCETHYNELFGNLCFVCNQVIYSSAVMALNKAWCLHHFACIMCDQKMTQKSKFYEFDLKPICKKCYERLPQELKKRLKRQHDIQARGGKPSP